MRVFAWTLWVLLHARLASCLHRVHANDDSSSLLHSNDDSAAEWSMWSQWSMCSRSCDGGVSIQLRQCLRKSGCIGDNARHRICNMQPCPEATDFRGTQCSAYNSVPYRGKLYEWVPFYDSSDPCSLTCQAKHYYFMAKLAQRVQDGTRCRHGALDMCVGGRCMSVGCDLKLGSTSAVDECGVCGGDGTSCKKPAFKWAEAPFSPCTVTCGGGLQESHPVCRSEETGQRVDERLCNLGTRPPSQTKDCNTNPCPPSWVIKEWSECSVSCGGGRQYRNVTCIRGGPNGTPILVEDHFCPGRRPNTSKSCNPHECPRWTEGQWSECSVSCGVGTQIRTVECRDSRGQKNSLCDPAKKPLSKQQCSTGNPCYIKSKDLGSQEDAPPRSYLPFSYYSMPQHHSREPIYVTGEWGPCSVTCGMGIQKRKVECKIFLEFSKTMASIPESECLDERPVEVRRCSDRPCAIDLKNETPSINHVDRVGIVVTYSWKRMGFTQCSASCLGGVQESLVQCVRDHDQSTVRFSYCNIAKKPDVITQTCNDIPCPPRWKVSEFGKCSKPCGKGGVQTREVQCIHEVTRGVGNTLMLSPSVCPQPPPVRQQECNNINCMAKWKSGQWTKCSKSCGGGVKTRNVQCRRVLANGTVEEVLPHKCPRRKPRALKECNVQPCKEDRKETFVQKTHSRKLTLAAAGKAVVFSGTTLKIKCPGSHGNGSHVQWLKNGKVIKPVKRMVISRKGALRIRRVSVSDEGKYTCKAGLLTSSLALFIRPPPGVGGYGHSEEDKVTDIFGRKVPANSEGQDFSHENRITSKNDKDKNYSHKPHHRTHSRLPSPKASPLPLPETTAEVFDSSELAKSNGGPQKAVPSLTNDHLYYGKSKGHPETSTSFDTWEMKQHLPADQQESDELNRKVVAGAKGGNRLDMDEPPVPSGAASNHGSLTPIQSLLTKIHHTLGYASHEPTTDNGDELDPEPKSYILGRGNAENLEFDWMITSWSPCSQTCGGTGFQVRAIQCMVRLNNNSKTVDDNLCVDAGLKTPETIQKCGIDECPRWTHGNWSECTENNCFAWQIAIQEREVHCQLPNGTYMEEYHCDASLRPLQKKECINQNCKGVWKVEEWSECIASCGKEGFKTRILQCVWFGTNRPAGNACRNQKRPESMKSCIGPPCSSIRQGCVDHSRNCQIIHSFNMCHMNYGELCCATCQQR